MSALWKIRAGEVIRLHGMSCEITETRYETDPQTLTLTVRRVEWAPALRRWVARLVLWAIGPELDRRERALAATVSGAIGGRVSLSGSTAANNRARY